MGVLLACVLVLGSGEDFVRLQLRDGKVQEGTIVNIDPDGRYLVRTPGGESLRIPYQEVLNVQILRPGEGHMLVPSEDPEWPLAPRQADLLAFVSRHLAEVPDSKHEGARLALGRAIDTLRAQNFKDALAQATVAVDLDPSWDRALLLRSALWAELGFSAQASEDVAAILRFTPELVVACEVAAEIAYRRGLSSQGDELYAQVLARRYSGAEGDWRLGHFWLTANREKAEAHFEAYLAADPGLAQPFSVEGKLLLRARQERAAGRLERAGWCFDALFRGSPVVAQRYSEEFGGLLRDRAERLSAEGKAEAAAQDALEAARLLPGGEGSLEDERRSLDAAALYSACRKAAAPDKLASIDEQLLKLFGELPAEARDQLSGAYGRLCAQALRELDAVRAADCMTRAHELGWAPSDRPEIVRALRELKGKLSPEDAKRLSSCLYKIDPSFLVAEAGFLLDVQLERLRVELNAGRFEAVREGLDELDQMFVQPPAVARLRADWELRRTRRGADVLREAAGSSEEPASGEELLAWFPLDEGRWWEYVSADGRRERWRIREVERQGETVAVRFEGEAVGPEGSLPAAKDIYFTGNAIYAFAPSWETGGRLLLWVPRSPADETRRHQQGSHLYERSQASRGELVTIREKTFRDCRHVVARSSIVDSAGGPTRFQAESHFWYAPEVGLVRVKDDYGHVWELVDWGTGYGEGRAEEPAAKAGVDPSEEAIGTAGQEPFGGSR